ncbi:MAG: class I SAM-dependent methyltransferase [Pseudoxanthomonas sp.]|nr:class I SAM-dependent methyltransferase [Pseudoxanthomonas sp.]
MDNDKPYSPACERNRDPILEVLRGHLAGCRHVLEIGSGTGQHAVHFADAMPWLTWQCSDRAEYSPGIRRWLADAALPNTPLPLTLDVSGAWPVQSFDAVYSANTLHIMGWDEVQALFAGVAALFARDGGEGRLAVYGPFNIGGEFTSDSNREFDASLRVRDPRMGLRDLDAVDALASSAGLSLVEDAAMPANNRLLVWAADAQAPAIASRSAP